MNIAAMDIAHIHQLIPDYVLGLLSADDSQRVEQHARQCPLCREAIQHERLVEFRVRGAVQLAARPPAGRLEALRPPLPSPSGRGLGRGPLPSPFGRGLGRGPLPSPSGRGLGRGPLPSPSGRGAPAMALIMLLVVVLLAQVGGYGLPTPGFGRAVKAPTTLAATNIASATLTSVNWSSAPPPAPEPAPRLSSDAVPGANLSDPTAAATPIITLAR